MTQPDYREKAVNIAAKIVSDAIEKGERPAQSVERLAQAIADAHLAGRREGIEEERERFKLWGTDECRSCNAGRITLYHLSELCVECQSRALLEGGK